MQDIITTDRGYTIRLYKQKVTELPTPHWCDRVSEEPGGRYVQAKLWVSGIKARKDKPADMRGWETVYFVMEDKRILEYYGRTRLTDSSYNRAYERLHEFVNAFCKGADLWGYELYHGKELVYEDDCFCSRRSGEIDARKRITRASKEASVN